MQVQRLLEKTLLKTLIEGKVTILYGARLVGKTTYHLLNKTKALIAEGFCFIQLQYYCTLNIQPFVSAFVPCLSASISAFTFKQNASGANSGRV
jgi:hypothetical protein